MHWILTEFVLKDFASIAPSKAVVISFAATFLQSEPRKIRGGSLMMVGLFDCLGELGISSSLWSESLGKNGCL